MSIPILASTNAEEDKNIPNILLAFDFDDIDIATLLCLN